jgi:hypothetical protein
VHTLLQTEYHNTDVLPEFRYAVEGNVESYEIVLVPTPTDDVNDPLVSGQAAVQR